MGIDSSSFSIDKIDDFLEIGNINSRRPHFHPNLSISNWTHKNENIIISQLVLEKNNKNWKKILFSVKNIHRSIAFYSNSSHILVQIDPSKWPAVSSVNLTESKVKFSTVNREFSCQTSSNGHIPGRAEKVGKGIFWWMKTDWITDRRSGNRQIIDRNADTVLISI